MGKYKNIDEKIRLGYEYESKNEITKACDIWLDAWEGIKGIIEEEKLKNIEALEPKYNWFQFISNYVQDLEMELSNAGQYKEDYHKKRIRYCEEMIKVLDSGDQLTIENTRRAIADSHYALGNLAECDRLYSNWLKADPVWGWGYIGVNNPIYLETNDRYDYISGYTNIHRLLLFYEILSPDHLYPLL